MYLKKELARAVSNRKYEQTDTGIFFPASRIAFNNFFDISVNGSEPEFFPNTVVNEGLDYILETALRASTPVATWYIAPFAGNVTPTSSWTAANFATNSTEFTNYVEASRRTWASDAVAGQSVTNSTRAVFTVDAGGQTTIWGAGLLSASGRSATTGVLVAAAKLVTARSGLQETDEVSIGYTVSIADNS